MEITGITVHPNQLEEVSGITSEYPYVMHLTDLCRTAIPWHWHDELEFCYVENGNMKVSTIEQTYEFKEGEGFFINSNILASMEAIGDFDHTLIISHLFHPIFLSGHFKSIFDTKYISPIVQNRRLSLAELRTDTAQQRRILSLLKKASQLQNTPDCEFQTRNIFSEIWLLLTDHIKTMEKSESPLKSAEQVRIQTMLSYIHENYARHLTLSEIASSASVSSRECTRCFKTTIQKTPFEYVMEYRIQAAARMLKNTDSPITDIALNCGFSSSAYFGKIFREYKKTTPSAYRKTAPD